MTLRSPPRATQPLIPMLYVDTRTIGFRSVVTLRGEVDMSTCELFRHALADVLDTPAREVWLDVRALTFMDSTGLHALLDCAERLRDDRRRMTLICGAGAVRRMLEQAGVAERLAIVADRSAAM